MGYDTLHLHCKVKNVPIDFLKLKNKPVKWMNLNWQPSKNKLDKLNCYYTYIGNLKLILKGDVIYLKNSLQKFYMNNNYLSFTYSQVVDAFDKLNQILPFNVYDATVTRLAIGLSFEENAQKIVNDWSYYLGKPPMQMQDKNKIYGAKFHLTDYYIKGYDKTYQVKSKDHINLNKPYFRYEIEGKTKFFNSKTNNINIKTVADLVDKDKYIKLCNMLINRYNMIEKVSKIDYSECTFKEKKLIAYMENPNIKQSVKNQHSDSYKKDRKAFNKLMLDKIDNKYQNSILNKLNQQIQYSINN